MTGVRPPTIAGVGGGVGVTTLAVALRARDAGRTHADAADIVVCRGRLDSLRRAAAVLDRAGSGPRPVLAVTLDGARLPRGPLRARLLLLEPAASAVVLLPHVRHWPSVADPLAEAATLLVDAPERLPRPVRTYTEALRELAAAVAESGRLVVPAPARPEAAGSERARPERGEPAGRPTRFPPDLDRAADHDAWLRPPGAVRLQAVPVFGDGHRPAPQVLAPGRPVAAPPPDTSAPTRPFEVAARERRAAPRRGVRIVGADPHSRPSTADGRPARATSAADAPVEQVG